MNYHNGSAVMAKRVPFLDLNANMTRPKFQCNLVVLCMTFSITLVLTLSSDAIAQKKKPAPRKPAKIRLPASVLTKEKVKMNVVQVAQSQRSAIKSAASQLDSLVDRQLINKNVNPGPLASDEVFMRRVYLDIAGRIPSLDEATAFLKSTKPQKREDLIDELLGSPGYVSNMYNFWADTLRLIDRPQNNIIAMPFLGYVKDAIRTNKKYDKWVYEMLTADGKVWEDPAVGFRLRDDGMPLPYVDNTVRVFLGTQIGCAQCHDHPFDVWTQYQFYELAAFTNGTRTRIARDSPQYKKGNMANDLIKKARAEVPNGRISGQLQRMLRANNYSVSHNDKAAMRLPHDYAYDDAKPNDVVKAKVLWGEIPTSASKSTKRDQFAAWLTSPENPQFSKTVVNRYWKRFMGVGLVEPVDDFNDDHPCSNEPLMDFMAKELIRSDFNLQELVRMICYSNSYQRVSTDYSVTSGKPYYFPGPVMRRMTAEQVWDSLLTLAVNNPWPYQRPTAEDFAPVINVDFPTATLASVKQQAKAYTDTYDVTAYNRRIRKHGYQGNILCRASELPSPAPASHFLRQFGQGDREVINGAQQDATVPQILAMFNGPITHVMLEEGSTIVNNVMKIDSTKDRINAIFLSVLGRQPNPMDRVAAASELSKEKNDNVGYGNIVWALLNTREFLFIQ